MFARLLLLPFIAATLIFLYLSWEVDPEEYSGYILPGVISVVVIFLLGPQINWWWWQRFPPELSAGLRALFEARLPFYQRLPEREKKRFRHRVALFLEANEFMPQAMEIVPPDVKGIIAATAVQLTFWTPEFLFKKYENIVVYPHVFPSPQYLEHWHASEIYDEDGVILFSAEQLTRGFAEPTRFFHIGLYEYARAWMRSHPKVIFPAFGGDIWEKLEQVSGFSQEHLSKWIGLPEVDVAGVAVAHLFVFPERFRQVLPEEFEAMAGIFGMNQRSS